MVDTQRADGSWVRVSVQGPPARYGNAMAYDPSRQRTVLFGGLGWTSNGTIDLGDTWEWDGASWIHVSNAGPSPRHGHGMVYDPDVGDPDGGVVPGTAFEDIPDDWFCPVCGARKRDFSRLD